MFRDTRLVTISTDNMLLTNEYRDGTFGFLHTQIQVGWSWLSTLRAGQQGPKGASAAAANAAMECSQGSLSKKR